MTPSRASAEDCWQYARFMPTIDHELKRITIVAFDNDTRRRLGQLQGEMRRLNYV